MGIDAGQADLLALTMMALTAFQSGKLWWARPYANAVNPNISLRANAYATVFVVATLYPLTGLLGMSGTALCMLSQVLLLTLFFRRLESSTAEETEARAV